VDGYMNIALEKCEEHVNGVKKRSYGDAFVRGNNGEIIFELYGRPVASLLIAPYSDVYLSRCVMERDSSHGIA
jgi:LSM domain